MTGGPAFLFLAKTYPVSTFKDMLSTKGKEQGRQPWRFPATAHPCPPDGIEML
jgi:hypothetical protein